MNAATKLHIAEMLVESAGWTIEPSKVPFDLDLMPSFEVDGVEYRLDSLALLDLSIELSDRFSVVIPDNPDVDRFRTLDSIAEYVHELLSRPRESGAAT